jgi:purine-binding chemotaxis protein CheW
MKLQLWKAMVNVPPLVMFRLNAQRYAFPLGIVERIVQAVEVSPLPKAPRIVLGVIDVEGRVLPVLDLRHRLGKPSRGVVSTDHFLIAHAGQRDVVLVIDEALDVIHSSDTVMVEPAGIAPGLEHLQGVVQLEDGLVFIHDLEKFLSLDEEHALAAALEEKEAADAS